MLKDCNIQLEASPFPLLLYLNFMTKRSGNGNQDGEDGEDVGTRKGKEKGAHISMVNVKHAPSECAPINIVCMSLVTCSSTTFRKINENQLAKSFTLAFKVQLCSFSFCFTTTLTIYMAFKEFSCTFSYSFTLTL